MVSFDFSFVLLHLSALFSLMFILFISRVKHKTQLHYSFIGTIFLLFVWAFGHILEIYSMGSNDNLTKIFVSIYYFGLIFIPPFIFLTGLVYRKTKVKINYKIGLLFVFPIADYVMLLTNDIHHLYFVKYSIFNHLIELGIFFSIHTVVSYAFIFTGMGLLIVSSIKNSGFFSRQSTFIIIGFLIPLVINILTTLRIFVLPAYYTAISFAFAIFCFTYAIFRYNFLKIAPIALQTVVDMISDGFLVVNEDNIIIDYNKTMVNTFKSLVSINRNTSLNHFLEKTGLKKDSYSLLDLLTETKINETTISRELHIDQGGFDKYFSIELTPIISKKNHLGTIILFKDITQNIKHIETIEEKHAIMMEQERLASLGQLIGGIAHNLKTPIMSISGAVEGLRDLVAEYDQSIGDASVTDQDHHEIATEMRGWLDKIKPYCAYMTDIIDTVKGQAMKFNATNMMSFTVSDLVKRIELLMKYELIRYRCKLNTTIHVNFNTELYGDINSLVQVFDNIIINAIQAYKKKNGEIDFIIEDHPDGTLFMIRDYAKGIPESIKNKLLKEMITTKGKDGTGLGLYMSYSTIKGRFGGKMWFESEEGKGTTFYIQLPRKNK